MRIFVTGAAGFIGSHLCSRLSEVGHTVLGVDCFDRYYSAEAKAQNASIVRAAGAGLDVIDVRRADDVLRSVRDFGPDSIVHLAGLAGVRNSVEFPASYIEANVGGMTSILEAARLTGPIPVVMASTSSVYAGSDSMPFSESYAATTPLQPYAASKRAAELIASTYHHLYDVQTTVTRFFTVYGERGRPDMMPIKLARSIALGESVTLFDADLSRDWTHVSDIVEGLRLAAERPGGFRVLNLGRGAPVSLRDFIGAMERIAGRPAALSVVPCPPSEMLSTFADTSSARALIGFDPVVTVDEGVDRLWSWFQTDEAIPWRS